MLSCVLRRLCSDVRRRTVLAVSAFSTVDVHEAEKFSLEESEWWDIQNGPLAPLHSMNTIRVPLIKRALIGNKAPLDATKPLNGYKILDVGCGGGILCEPLSRLGADVVGIDPTATAITVAKTRAERDYGITKNLTYYCCSVEELQDIRSAEADSGSDKGRGEKPDIRGRVNEIDGVDNDYMSEGEFDCVVASEVAEHVSNLEMFVENIGRIVKPGGSAIFTTINRTISSFLFAKIGAEYIFNIVPRGTHEWNKFVPPVELKGMLKRNGLIPTECCGMFYNILTSQWSSVSDTSLNYYVSAFKLSD